MEGGIYWSKYNITAVVGGMGMLISAKDIILLILLFGNSESY